MYAGAVCGLRVRLAVKNSVAIVLVGVLPCTQLADAACKCGLRHAVVFGQGLNFAASYRKQHRTFLLKIFKAIWYQNLRLIKLDTMVIKIRPQTRKLQPF